MDFIFGFSEVKGMRSILVVIDRFSKYAVFIPAPNVCTVDVASKLIFGNVIKLFVCLKISLMIGTRGSLVGFGRHCST